jgi:hypothetical protein
MKTARSFHSALNYPGAVVELIEPPHSINPQRQKRQFVPYFCQIVLTLPNVQSLFDAAGGVISFQA